MEASFFSPSINILRDQKEVLNYIPTRNSEKAFEKITASFSNGAKSFNIIGAYGSGKSAFLIALTKVLEKKSDYFSNPLNVEVNSFETYFIVGEYSSFKSKILDVFDLSKKNYVNDLASFFNKKAELKIGQLIIVDEFGKYLEYAAKENPEDELYFIQQLAEFANSPNLPILFITTLHQAFEDYALGLTSKQKREWDKVKGRLIEVSFNEPVEQLLLLASERIIQKRIRCNISLENQFKLFEIIQDANAFPMKDHFTFEFAKKLFPFDILSGAIATLAFQKYGQNERSLFSFLESEEYLGINDFVDGSEFYHIGRIYDYLKYNFYTLLNSRYNPDALHWKSIEEAIQRAESIFDEDLDSSIMILKVIGLLSIFGRKGQKITKDFLNTYSQIALKINDSERIIAELEKNQLIRFRDYSQKYVLFKGTDFDISFELELAEGLVSRDISISQHLKRHFNFPILPAKRVFYERGTPRHFVFDINENPINETPRGHIDGYIELIVNDSLDENVIRAYSRISKEPILYGWFRNSELIRNKIIEIEKIQIVKKNCIDDAIATAELDSFLYFAKEELNKLFQSSFYGAEASVSWFFNGEKKYFKNAKDLNSTLSEISERIYHNTPVYKNELINREKVSGTISLAKKKLIEQIIKQPDKLDLGFDEKRFPPEKTIYLSLLKNTGIHQIFKDKWVLGRPNASSFYALWDVCEKFLDDCTISQREISDLIEILRSKPFKLKQGFIDFWIPIFLLAKQKSIALYEQDIFVPSLTSDTLEVVMKQPAKYQIRTYNLTENQLRIFNRYRFFLNQNQESSPDSCTFIETVKPFLVFYNRLVDYTKNTKNLSNNAIRLRDAISQATNPVTVFFEDIPRALGFTLNESLDNKKLEKFSIALQDATRELSSAFPGLVNRIEEVINYSVRDERIDFPENKLLLQERFAKLKSGQIDHKLRVLINRINTPLEDRQSWINSIATAIIDKPIDQFYDSDEDDFKSIFYDRIHELDNLTEISRKDIDHDKEVVFKLELTSLVKGIQRNLIRLPKTQADQIDQKKQVFKKMLNNKDKKSNIVLLIKLLQEEIENE